jgi:hypothetical protein
LLNMPPNLRRREYASTPGVRASASSTWPRRRRRQRHRQRQVVDRGDVAAPMHLEVPEHGVGHLADHQAREGPDAAPKTTTAITPMAISDAVRSDRRR